MNRFYDKIYMRGVFTFDTSYYPTLKSKGRGQTERPGPIGRTFYADIGVHFKCNFNVKFSEI